ncbi:10268_t:CDS:2 [Cetraspora pellucida]|uniref:10268_t:CDS:1 n=1 Tax=Cetraspora pellucida TaxID=1433469 RepID=A0ACA9MA34_9GLOM|nr:10268_t:CDS:2 [Cetraspora pellucida]
MTICSQESLIFVVGQMEVIDNKFYINAKDINYINVKKKNSKADDSQISSTSTNPTRSKLLNIYQNIIKNLRDTSMVQSPSPSNIENTFLTKHKRTDMTDDAIVDADFATSVDHNLKNTEISLKSDQEEFEKITKNKNTKISNLSQHTSECHDLGHMNIKCVYCNALHWYNEYLTSSSYNHLKFDTCCLHEKVILPLLQDLPLLLYQLFEGQDERSKEFKNNIHQYNAANAFTSLGTNIDKSILDGRGLYNFCINSELYHHTGSLLSESSVGATYAQLYIYDPEVAHYLRMG